MHRSLSLIAVVGIAAAAIAGSQSQAQNDLGDLQKALEQLGKAAQGAQGNTPPAKPVALADLKAIFPEQLGGIKRSNLSAERNTAMGMQVTTAEAEYSADEKSIQAKLTDMSGMGALGAIAQMGWTMGEVERESDTGYERTTTIAGQKALEKWEKEGSHATIQIYVSKRFLVEIEGRGLDIETVKKAVGEIDFAKLDALAK